MTFSHVWLFFEILFCTLGGILVCGLVVGLCQKMFCALMGHGFGRVFVIGTSIIGTPVHELGHAAMCLLFGHKITEMSLWQPWSKDGNLGFVTHRFNPKNPYHQLGNLFIGVGPVFSGLAVMLLVLLICFPNTLESYAAAASDMVNAGEGGVSLLLEGMKMLPHMIGEWSDGARPVWARIIAMVVMLSVSLHINLSPADIKGALSAVPLYLLLALIATVIISLLGEGIMSVTRSVLYLFSAGTFALFTVVLVFSLLQVALALVIYFIRRLFGLK